MVLLDDIVEVLRLAQHNGQTAVGLNPDDCGRVGAALVDGDFLGHVVQANGAFEECAGCGEIALGAKQKIDGVAVLVYGPV